MSMDSLAHLHMVSAYELMHETKASPLMLSGKMEGLELRTLKENGTMISYDLNYRPSLWKDIGGSDKAIEVNREIANYVDVMLGSGKILFVTQHDINQGRNFPIYPYGTI